MDPLIPKDFIHFVECIEGNVDPVLRVTFANAQEMQVSVKYFFERAAANIEISEKFAQQIDRVKYVFPTNEKPVECTNLRKTMVLESKQQIEDKIRRLRDGSEVNTELAKGTFKFFGELFNIGFIFLDILNKQVRQLERLIYNSTPAFECLVMLVQTVKTKVLNTHDDNSTAYQELTETIMKPQYNLAPTPASRSTNASPFRSTDQAGPSRLASQEMLPNNDRMTVFVAIIDSLTENNVEDACKRIISRKNEIFSSDAWRVYFDKLIAKALSLKDSSEYPLAGFIATICYEMSKSTDIYLGVTNNDCKEYVNRVLAREIQICPIAIRENAIINFLKMLVGKNYFNVGHIGNILAAAVKLSGINKPNSIIVLFKFLDIVKSKFPPAKIEKLPEEITMKVIEIIGTDSRNAVRAKMFSKYLLGQREVKVLEYNSQKVLDFLDNYQTSASSSDEHSGNMSEESENEEDETPEDYDENAQKMPEDLQILEKVHKILNELTEENMKTKSFEMLTLIHQNRKKIQLITSNIMEDALSKPENVPLYIEMLQYLEKSSGNTKSIPGSTTTECIAKFFLKIFGNNAIHGKLSDDHNMRNLHVLRLMFKLYEGKVVGKFLAIEVLRSLMKVDNVSEAAVSLVVEFMTKIGQKLEQEDGEKIRIYFEYFQCAVDLEENITFKSLEYTKLIAFRKNGWKTPTAQDKKRAAQNGIESHKKLLAITLDFDDLNDENLYGVVLKLRSILNTEEHVELLVKALLNYKTIDFERISAIAGLIQKLSEIQLRTTSSSSINLVEIVNELLTEEFIATNALQVLEKDSEMKFTRLVTIASELYQRNVIKDEEILPWLLHRHLYQLPIEVLVHVDRIISLRRKPMVNKTLVAAFFTLETSISIKTANAFVEMQKGINVVEEKLESLRKLKVTNSATS